MGVYYGDVIRRRFYKCTSKVCINALCRVILKASLSSTALINNSGSHCCKDSFNAKPSDGRDKLSHWENYKLTWLSEKVEVQRVKAHHRTNYDECCVAAGGYKHNGSSLVTQNKGLFLRISSNSCGECNKAVDWYIVAQTKWSSSPFLSIPFRLLCTCENSTREQAVSRRRQSERARPSTPLQ